MKSIRLSSLALLFVLGSFLFGGESGYIQVVSPPGVQILLDGVFKGVTVAETGGLIIEDVPSGSRTVRAVRAGFAPQDLTVVVRVGGVSKVEVGIFRPRVQIEESGGEALAVHATVGRLIIETLPVECQIDLPTAGLAGQSKTKETLTADGVPVGTHAGRFRALGKDLSANVPVEQGRVTKVFVNFVKGTVEVTPPPKLGPSSTQPPAKPAWAATVEKDAQGHYADLPIGGLVQRMRWIQPGYFEMGCDDAETDAAWEDFKKVKADAPREWFAAPQHAVTLTKPYWLADSECTQALWQSVMGNNPSHFKGATLPVEQVSWEDCQQFVQRVQAAVPGSRVRLPTEAEWEYACRAGTTTSFAGPSLDTLGWYRENSGETTHAVRGKQSNAWGLYDMHGNVWEWCADWYGDYPAGALSDPIGPASGSDRVCRGGSWRLVPGYCRSARRHWLAPGLRGNGLGFRVLIEAK